MWLLDYENVGFVMKDQTERKDRVVRKAAICLMNDDRFTVTRRCYMLCAFGASTEFARKYESCEASGWRWPASIKRGVAELTDYADCTKMLADGEDEADVDLIDSEGWDSD